jgi:hypothetical protein
VDEGARTYSKVDLAVQQLSVALLLFLDEQSYAAALTLAGAAEEVLGKAVKYRGGTPTMQRKFQASAEFFELLEGKPLKWADFAAEENAARNALKHMRSLDDTTFTADLEDAAVWMLVRACDNCDRLDLEKTDDMRRFDDWFYENIAGIYRHSQGRCRGL